MQAANPSDSQAISSNQPRVHGSSIDVEGLHRRFTRCPRRSGRSRLLPLVIAVLAPACASHGSMVIDTMAADHALLVSSVPGSAVTLQSTQNGPIVGTAASTRTAYVWLDAPLAGGQAAQLAVAVGRGVLAFGLESEDGYASAAAARGRVTWTYAGGVNLAGAGDRFLVDSTLSGGAATLTVQVTDAAGRAAVYQTVAPGATEVAFSSLDWNLDSGWAGFTNVSTVTLEWTASGPSANQAFSVFTRVNEFLVVPAPASLVMLGVMPLTGRLGRGRRRGA